MENYLKLYMNYVGYITAVTMTTLYSPLKQHKLYVGLMYMYPHSVYIYLVQGLYIVFHFTKYYFDGIY